jgi:hypothetical protein
MREGELGARSTLQKLFISHSDLDWLLAKSFKDTLGSLFPGIEVGVSSDSVPGAGPAAGSSWLEWVYRQILECQETLLLLTPHSLQRPWPVWEAGAVAGVAMASQIRKPVTPILFGLSEEVVLRGPFLVTQTFDGTSEAALRKLFGDLMRRHAYRDVTDEAVGFRSWGTR